MAVTPPPPGRAHTPPAPHHGAIHDSFEPFSPRRSRRVSERVQKSPADGTSLSMKRQRTERAVTPTRKTPSKRISSQTYSPPSSPASPQSNLKRPIPHTEDATDGSRSRNGVSLGTKASSLLRSSHADAAASLPTPSKTPRKKPGPSQAALSSTSRILFSNRPASLADTMPTPRKGRYRKPNGYGLDGSVEDGDADASDNIEVYTDSKERVPVKDKDSDNPFVTSPEDDSQARRRREPTKIRKNLSASEKRMEQAAENGEGLIYVFRGKRVFRKFDDGPSSSVGERSHAAGAELRRVAGTAAQKPLTRANVKPRLLFQRDEQQHNTEDEEAVTDIDERIIQSNASADKKGDSIEVEKEEQELVTPVKQNFGPATPPSTGRATRSQGKIQTGPLPEAAEPDEVNEDDQDPAPTSATVRRKRASPFDQWARTKPGSSRTVSGTKREGEALEKDGDGGGKRTRGKAVAGTGAKA
ncbi:MAG: hypothetical protein M1820_005552 [Bogoriella megaspora]|nr:MAG: hypothetical protein M1820_005552 [Bogoriella megaspora]